MTVQTFTHLAEISGGMLYVIAVVLLIGLAVIVDRTWVLGRASRRGETVRRALARLAVAQRPELERLANAARGTPHRALIETTLQRSVTCDWDHLGELLDESIMAQAPLIDRRLWVLDTIVTLGPLLGLLGTIIGIFQAFKVLGNPGAAPSQITGGVAEALVSTAAGLLVAIVGLVFFNGLQTRVRLVVHQLETLKIMLLNRVGKNDDGAGDA